MWVLGVTTVAVLAAGCFDKPSFVGPRDGGPDAAPDAGTDAGIDGPVITACGWEGIGDLLVYLPFDEVTGTMAADLSMMPKHGAVTGGIWTGGRISGALSLHGNQYVDLGTAPALDNIGEMTVCAWINMSQATPFAATIADKSYDGFVRGWNFYVQSGGGNRLGFLSNEGYDVYGSRTIVPGEWTHVCASWDGMPGFAGIKLYVNGIPESLNNGGQQDPPDKSDDPQHLILGRAAVEDEYHLDGKLDELYLFERALAPPEIAKLHSCAP